MKAYVAYVQFPFDWGHSELTEIGNSNEDVLTKLRVSWDKFMKDKVYDDLNKDEVWQGMVHNLVNNYSGTCKGFEIRLFVRDFPMTPQKDGTYQISA